MGITRDVLDPWFWLVSCLGLWVPVLAVVFWALGVLLAGVVLSCGVAGLCGGVVFVGGCVVDVLFCGVVAFVGVWLVGCVLFVGTWLLGWALFWGAAGLGFSSR